MIPNKSILIAAVTVMSSLNSAGANLSEDIAPYVYPRNAAATATAPQQLLSDGSYLVLSDDHRSIVQYDLKSGKSTGTLVEVSSARENPLPDIEGFTLSPDGNKLLVWRDSHSIYRRSFSAAYYIYEIRSKIMRPLSVKFARQRAPKFSPDSRMVAFVGDDNNIYLKKIDYNNEVAVTTDGSVNSIINGVPDWTYEEEFSVTSSMIFSPDSETFCYLRYDESQVPMYSLPIYGGSCEPRKEYVLYPGVYEYKYPVAGQPNSSVSLHCYDIDERKLTELPVGTAFEYVPRIEFTPEGKVLAVTLNRDQNRMEIMSINPASKVSRSVYVDEAKAWITPLAYEGLQLTADGFLVISERSGYANLYKYSYAGALQRTVMSARADVTACYGQDAQGNVYYQAAQPTPLDRTVYRSDAKGRATVIGDEQGWNQAAFTSDMAYVTVNHSDASTPPVYTLHRSDGSKVRVLEDNKEYAARFASLPKKEFFTMESDGVKLNGWIMRPAGFNPSQSYPVVMDQYSGPGSQSVVNRWQLDWQQYFAMQGYIVVCVDGRGTGGRGAEFRDIVYKKLGYYETIDQLNAARYAASLPGADKARIGICGWSYGGYECLMCITDKASPFAAAVAIAPVTDWRYYDTVYAERYMLTPNQNFDGYEQSAPINRAASVKCPLLVMYGTADDNVHPANSLEFVSAMQQAGLMCDMLVFPNMNHSINYCNARAVVYGNMLRYFNLHLK